MWVLTFSQGLPHLGHRGRLSLSPPPSPVVRRTQLCDRGRARETPRHWWTQPWLPRRWRPATSPEKLMSHGIDIMDASANLNCVLICQQSFFWGVEGFLICWETLTFWVFVMSWLSLQVSVCFSLKVWFTRTKDKLSNKLNFCNSHLRITCDYETISFWILLLNSTHCYTGLRQATSAGLQFRASRAVSTLYIVVVLAILLTRVVSCMIL